MKRERIGFWIGLLLFGAIMSVPFPEGMTPSARTVAAVTVLMASWWVSECVHMAAVALLPIALFPILKVAGADDVAKSYADPNVFLFLGGFSLALAMEKCGLHRRIALVVLRLSGTSPRRILAGFMIATGVISMWVSNTATTLMILPIALAVLGRSSTSASQKGGENGFAAALMLGIAYSSSIGGTATVLGSPPNMIFVGQARRLFPELPEIGFQEWMVAVFPVSAGFLAITWCYLAFVIMRRSANSGSSLDMAGELKKLGAVSRAEALVTTVFIVTAAAWITREYWSSKLGIVGLHDGAIAIASAILLFLLPDGSKGGRLLDWEWMKKVPWEVLALFGGGFALAMGFERSGLAVFLARGFGTLDGLDPVVLVLIVCLAATFLSEFMSNTAQVSLMLPVLAAASQTLAMHPYQLMLSATLAASFAFMMPVGTPPNAIVFASGHVRLPQMVRTGLVLNILGAIWITFMSVVWFGHRV